MSRLRASRRATRNVSRLTALDRGDRTAAGRLSQRLMVAAAVVQVEFPRWAASATTRARHASVSLTADESTAGPNYVMTSWRNSESWTRRQGRWSAEHAVHAELAVSESAQVKLIFRDQGRQGGGNHRGGRVREGA